MTAHTDPVAVLSRESDAAVQQRKFVLPLAPSLERRRLEAYLTLMVCDTIGIAVAFLSVNMAMTRHIALTSMADLLA